MYRSTIRWTTAAAAAALIALPVAGAAQTTGTTSPQQPSAQTQQPPAPQPQPQPQPAEPTTTPQQPPATAERPAQPGQVDATSAKKHLSEARDTLSQITSMPEAAKLQGDNRTQVSQLISNFNELITTQANWRDAYSKVEANLNSLLGPEGSEPAAAATGTAATTGTAGSTGTAGTAGSTGTAGTSGATAATASLDPAIRAKLAEFRTHLKMFEKAAGGGEPASGAMTSAAAASAPNPANPSADPANPAAAATPANPSQPPSSSGAVGTSGVTPSPTGSMVPMDQSKAAEQVGHAEADKHLDAIDEILSKSKTGTLTKAQTSEVKKHLDQLRALLKQRR